MASGEGIVKLNAAVVRFAVHVEHGPLGGDDERAPGLLGSIAPDDGDAK